MPVAIAAGDLIGRVLGDRAYIICAVIRIYLKTPAKAGAFELRKEAMDLACYFDRCTQLG